MSRKIPTFLIAAGFAAAALLVGLDTRAVDPGKGRSKPITEGLSASDHMKPALAAQRVRIKP